MFGFGGAPVGGGLTGFAVTSPLLDAAGMGFTGGGEIGAIPVGFGAGIEVAGPDADGDVPSGLNGLSTASPSESEASAHERGSATSEMRRADILEFGMANSSC